MKKKIKLIIFLSLLQTMAHSFAEAPLLKVLQSPSKPVLGQKSRLFVKWRTAFDNDRENNVKPILFAKIDGQMIDAVNPYGRTWVIDLPAYSEIEEHNVSFELFIEDEKEAEDLRKSIETLEQEIYALNDSIANETDPDLKEQLILQRDAKVVERDNAQNQLLATKTKIKDESFSFTVVSNLELDNLYKNITLAQNRNILVQNDDGGWNYFDAPDVLMDRSETSYPNQFGLHAQAMLESYLVTANAGNLVAADRAAKKLYNDPVGVQSAPAANKPAARCVRGYATDYEFLGNAGSLLFPAYHARGQEHFNQEKICFAALFLAGTTNQNDDALIDAVSQQDIDNASDADRVAGFQARLVAANRNAGLRAFDWNGRIRGALIYGDTNFAKAIANQLATDAPSIAIDQDYYLMGLANTISSLLPFVNDEPSYQAIIDDLKSKLFAQQRPEGRFMVDASEGTEAGIVQDQAFILKALLDLGETEKAKNLVNYLLGAQLANGAYDWFWELGGSFEFAEGNSELLGSMALVYQANAGKSASFQPSRGNYVEKSDEIPLKNTPKAVSYQ